MVLRRMMGPSLETGAVLDAPLSGNYCAIAIACLRWLSHLFVMKKGPESIPNSAPIWQKRFYDFGVRTNVRTEEKQIEKLRYIHPSPVKRRLVGEQWEWSSFRSYLYQETGLVRVKSQEWPMEIKARPVAKFGEVNGVSLPLFAPGQPWLHILEAISRWILFKSARVHAASFSVHSRTRSTLQPSRRKAEDTLTSRRWLTTILRVQNALLLFGGRLHRVQPCQKHPSTKITIRNRANTKSGLPGNVGSFIVQPDSARATRCALSRLSVVRPCRDLTSDIMRDRAVGDTRSIYYSGSTGGDVTRQIIIRSVSTYNVEIVFSIGHRSFLRRWWT